MAQLKKTVFTIIDANINRAKEGLRVIEDITRFIYSTKNTTSEIKKIRHSITVITSSLLPDYRKLLESRDSESDAGRNSKLKTEFKRSGIDDIMISNFKRVEESLRVLEEVSKLIDADSSAKYKELRYMTYSLEKKLILNNPGN
jgi:thiamine-phosphate pyrophosphorylase